MLKSREFGYAVMNKELTAFSYQDINIETCKKYCRKGNVIVEMIPYVSGFSIRIMWYKWHKPISIKYPKFGNIFWLHWSVIKEYLHKKGKIIFEN